MSKYLEENGLAYFWTKIKNHVNITKQAILDTVWPIDKGGTGQTSPDAARNALSALGSKVLNNYAGITFPSGSDSGWIRVPTSGILPHTQNANGNGSIGSSSWPFANIYVKKINGRDPWAADVHIITINTVKNGDKINAGAYYSVTFSFSAPAGYRPAGVLTIKKTGTGASSLSIQGFNMNGISVGGESTLAVGLRNAGSSAIAKNALTFEIQIACVKVQ